MRNGSVLLVALVPLVLACADRGPEVEAAVPVPVLEWAARVDTLPGTYTRVMRPAEFWDSVLVVPDIGERLLWRVSLNSSDRVQLGSRGGGPGEFARVGWAFKVRSDSVAISQVSAWNAFPIISVTEGRGRTLSLRAEAGDSTSPFLSVAQPMLRVSDTLGHIYGAPTIRAPKRDPITKRPIGRGTGLLDTTVIVRFSVTDGSVDTLLALPVGYRPELTAPRPNPHVRPIGLGAYGPYNLWTASADGSLLVVDAALYRVRQYDPENRMLAEWTLPFSAIATSAEGWEAYVQQRTRDGIALLESTMRGVANETGFDIPRPTAPQYTVPEQPTTLPPVNGADGTKRLHTHEDILWIPVHRADPPGKEFWDVIDLTRGERLVTLALPENHRLVHTTALGAYIVAKDEDDLERVLLYRAPSTSAARSTSTDSTRAVPSP